MVFALLLLTSTLCSWHNFGQAKAQMEEDMNQALEKTLAQQASLEITIDTVRNYQSHLRTPQLRAHSFVYFASPEKERFTLRSKKMRLQVENASRDFQCFATCSYASMFSLSNQRFPLSLSLLALLWALGSLLYFRSRPELIGIAMGKLRYNAELKRFYNAQGRELCLTPMQSQLLALFFTASDHRLPKQQICDTLWPRKPDASETLYTLIRRTKPIVEQEGGLRIVCDRGKDYRIEEA